MYTTAAKKRADWITNQPINLKDYAFYSVTSANNTSEIVTFVPAGFPPKSRRNGVVFSV